MDTSTNSKSTTSGTSVVAVMRRRARAAALGALVTLAVVAPSVAQADYDIAQTPLFWEAGVRPNVALMIDDSGSMSALVTNESFKRALDAGTVASQDPWYFCTGYDPANKRCTGKTGISTFTARVWAPPALSTTANSITIGKTLYNSESNPSNCNSGSNGWARTGTSGNYTIFCRDGHGLPNGAVINYISGIPASGSGTASTSSLSTTQDYYVVNSATRGFQLSKTFNGPAMTAAEMGPLTIGTASGSFLFKGVKITSTLPNYVNKGAALCDVTQPPTSPTFYVGAIEGSGTWLSIKRTTMPTANQIGVIVSNSGTNPSPANTDSCVRWQMATTQSSTDNTIPAGRDGSATEYDVDGYAEHLLNTLSTATPSSMNFDNETTYPNFDSDTKVFTAADDDKVIPNVNRMEAAREAARQIVLDNYDKMNIGLFSFKESGGNYYGEMNQSCGTEATAAANKTALIGSAMNTPMAATDGAIGALRATHYTPLARSLYEITQYFQGSNASYGGASYTSPILYRCQKNYAVLLTDGDATEDRMAVTANSNAIDSAVAGKALMNWDGMTEGVDAGSSWGSDCDNTNTCSWLDDIAQFAADGDFKATGNDLGGVTFNDATNLTDDWVKQSITTYTIGLGLENDILKRTPLTNTVTVTASNVGSSTITAEGHGLATGDYLLVTANGGSSLTVAASDSNLNGRYYVIKVDGDKYKLATSKTNALAGTSVSFTNPGSDIKLSTGPGKSFFAFTPEELSDSLGQVFNNIKKLTASASAVATNSKGSSGDTLIYQAKFNTEDWSGELSAYEFIAGDVDTENPYWTTSVTLNSVAEKKPIYTVNDSTALGVGVDFAFGNVSAAQQLALANGGGAVVGANVVNWFKGIAVTGFRDHSVKGFLGDVINADPLYVQAFNYGYDKLLDYSSGTPTPTGTGADSYKAFVEAKKRTYKTDGTINVAGRTPMLYVGSNDGQLHAFKAETGEEVMSFIPAGVYVGKRDLNSDGDFADTVGGDPETENKLFNLTQTEYAGDKHRFFVDGSAAAGDIYTSGGWKTYLAGTLGGGGKSVYVLDISNPEGFGAGSFKYEFKDTNNLGFTYGNPIIAHFADNNWYAVFPNGPDSKNDTAGVWLLNLNSGAGTFLPTGSGTSASPNGMMSVALKVNAARTVTAIYAGDLKGQVWKFDVFNDVTSLFQTGSGRKLFTAPVGQAITGGLRLGRLPTIASSTLKGTLVFFGTGKYFEKVDKNFTATSVPQTDALYAVLDEDTGTDDTVIEQALSDLSEKTMTTSGNFRYAATAASSDVNYKDGARGWYIKLLNNGAKEGERSVTTPLLFGDRIIFTTLIPSAGDRCLSSGSGWLLEFDPLNGTMLASPPLDTNGDGVVDSTDNIVAGAKLDGIITEPAVIPGQNSDTKAIGSTNTQKSISLMGESKPPGAGGDGSGKGRTSWRQLQ